MKIRLLAYLAPFLCVFMLSESCKTTKSAAQKKKYMQATYEDLKKSIPGADVRMLNDTVKVIFPNDVIFDFASAAVKPELFPTIQRFAEALREHSKTEILICGYTDNIGTEDRNAALSQRRADSAKTLLHSYKVKTKRMYTWGLGSKDPVASNGTEEGRQKNRRVVFVILYDYKP
ncbi:OmpA family protein [Chitinophagaceae bacterium MMS25-I14]